MDSKITGSNLLESAALAAGVVPTASLEALLPIIRARAVLTAVNLGIFEALANGPLTSTAISDSCGIRSDGVSFLLRTLAWAGYLDSRRSDEFALSKTGRNAVLSSSPKSQIGFIAFSAHITGTVLPLLEECLRDGRGIDVHRTMTNPNLWAAYQRAMMEGARFAAPTLARLIPVKRGAQKLLDVAGSHGLLGAAICRRHLPMRSTVLDLPNAVEHARALARELKIDDIVAHRAGDLLTDSYGDANDVVLFSNILHNIETPRIPVVLARAFDSCSPGGTIAIWDVETPERTQRAAHGDALALFCWSISSSGVFPAKAYADWLSDAGLLDVTVKHPKSNPGQVLVTGRKSIRR